MVGQQALDDLLDLTWRAATARADKITGAALAKPPVVPVEGGGEQTRYSPSFPVLRHLGRAVEIARPDDLSNLAKAFADLAPDLEWSQNASYTQANCSRSFLDGYAYASLSGPEGPVVCAAPRTGLMLMGPDVLYPGHHHGPREFYLVMTPGAQWRLDGGDWFDVEVGDLILHAPWQMHEMRTTREPMLALAGWVEAGDRNSIAWENGGGVDGA